MLRKLTILLIVIICACTLQAQNDSIPTAKRSYPPINENDLIETKWKYTYTAHVETNNIVHKADVGYDYYLHLRHDYTFEYYLNGVSAEGPWVLNEDQNEIFYKFRNIRWWRIAELTPRNLVLEFSLGNASYQYNFVSVASEDAPFVKRANELPDIEVKGDGKRKAIAAIKDLISMDRNKREARRQRRRDRRRERRAKRDERRENRFERRYNSEKEQTFIEIAVIGGGFYGGLDPVIKDFTILRNTGVVVKEFESVNKGLIKTTTEVPRDDMERFVKFIISKKFFDYENLYDCVTTDCVKRKGKKPTPIPLRLSVQYGSLRKVVTVGIWGLDDSQTKYVDYPEDIDLIVDGLQQLLEM